MALFCVVSCVFVLLPYGVPGYVWHLIVSITDLCFLPLYNTYLENHSMRNSQLHIIPTLVLCFLRAVCHYARP